jgi:hypothetical protein
MEISAGPQWVREFNFRSFTDMKYLEYDICAQTLDRQFDLIIADQIFEHLKWPGRPQCLCDAKTWRPFHRCDAIPFRVHRVPIDCSRWTEDGISYLLQEYGFPAAEIKTGSWGNRACVKGNFHNWPRAGYRSLVNEPDFPVVVWAFARKPLEIRYALTVGRGSSQRSPPLRLGSAGAVTDSDRRRDGRIESPAAEAPRTRTEQGRIGKVEPSFPPTARSKLLESITFVIWSMSLKNLLDFFDFDMLQLFESENLKRFLFDT